MQKTPPQTTHCGQPNRLRTFVTSNRVRHLVAKRARILAPVPSLRFNREAAGTHPRDRDDAHTQCRDPDALADQFRLDPRLRLSEFRAGSRNGSEWWTTPRRLREPVRPDPLAGGGNQDPTRPSKSAGSDSSTFPRNIPAESTRPPSRSGSWPSGRRWRRRCSGAPAARRPRQIFAASAATTCATPDRCPECGTEPTPVRA